MNIKKMAGTAAIAAGLGAPALASVQVRLRPTGSGFPTSRRFPGVEDTGLTIGFPSPIWDRRDR